MPCESLDGLSGDWDPLKGTRRLPRVDPFGLGRNTITQLTSTIIQVEHLGALTLMGP